MTDSPDSLARGVAELHAQERYAEALALAESAVARFPQSVISHCNLGLLQLLAGRYEPARAAYQRALELSPDLQEARRGLAAARAYLGQGAESADSTSVVPFTGSGRAIEVLVPLTLGRGNIVLDGLFDPQIARVTKIAIELHGSQVPVPPHDVVFNAIGDADSAQDALGAVARTFAGSRILNPPQRVALTGRIELSERLRAIAGVRTPQVRMVDRSEAAALTFPILLRTPGYHAGEHFERVTGGEALDRVLAAMPGERLFAIEFLDTRTAHGTYEKYRILAIDGRLFPAHLAISSAWKVHYFSAEMEGSAFYREREAAFLRDPRGTIGASAWSALEAVAQAVGLDYAGIDFALDGAGDVVVFEANATMAVRYPPEEPVWEYRRPAVDAIREALREMLRRYSST